MVLISITEMSETNVFSQKIVVSKSSSESEEEMDVDRLAAQGGEGVNKQRNKRTCEGLIY